MRKLIEKQVVLATHNAGKVKEMQAILAPFGIQVLSAADLNLTEPEENGQTFIENAKIKAIAAAKEARLPALGDDSGLCVHALNNRPGIYSARYNEPKKNGFLYAMEKLNEELGNQTDRSAHFACALVIAWPDGDTEEFEGRVNGTLCWPVKEGTNGFGYDPMFVPDGYDRSFAELPAEVKNTISHRARALKLFTDNCL
ncbi:MAG: RdgB/HAM1 family non-canonical purine NTP pyrophosphatase [Alphaproteobacteria bacterium]|nr:RdgB/HAM1 family non-canonical purine NTP pyrophosphatase [Alphaproteobacteria bacterium]